MEVDKTLDEIFGVLTKSTSKPEHYLGVQNDVAERLRATTKKLYDLTKSLESSNQDGNARIPFEGALPELIVAGFDEEQIWQELELQNEPSLADVLGGVSRATAAQDLNFHDHGKSFKTAAVENKDEETNSDGFEDEDLEEEYEEDMDIMEEVDDDDEEDDPLCFDKDADDSDMSDEEKEMVALLAKARAMLPDDGDDDDDDSDDKNDDELNADFDTDKLGLSKKLTKKEGAPTAEASQSSNRGGKSKKRKTVVDDNFFKLADMEVFLEQEDAKEEKKISRESGKNLDADDRDDSDEEEFDYFAELPSSEDEQEDVAGLHYDDFFDPPQDERSSGVDGSRRNASKYNKSDLEEGQNEDEDDENEDEDSEDQEESDDEEGEHVTDVLGPVKGEQSSFQKRQDRLKKKISALEEAALDEKPWQLKGEIGATSRPENSLLQEDLDFEHTARLPPVITEETTKSLEDLIKLRIKDKSWDDVERKVKPIDAPQEYKKKVVLDQEKSKLSLGEIYEQEYLKQQQKEQEEKKDPDHEEIKKMMTSLFIKLDALSNFHYTPKPAAPEVKIISNMPSIAMEEVAPVSVSDATMLAPQEIQEKHKGELKADTEKTSTDRKRERREKKKRQKAKHAHIEAKQKALEKKGLGNKYAKEKAMRDLERQSKTGRGVNIIKDDKKQKSGLTSSTAFFSQLQDEVTAHIQSKKATKKRADKLKDKSAAKYKL